MRVLCHFFRPGPSNEEESGLVQIPLLGHWPDRLVHLGQLGPDVWNPGQAMGTRQGKGTLGQGWAKTWDKAGTRLGTGLEARLGPWPWGSKFGLEKNFCSSVWKPILSDHAESEGSTAKNEGVGSLCVCWDIVPFLNSEKLGPGTWKAGQDLGQWTNWDQTSGFLARPGGPMLDKTGDRTLGQDLGQGLGQDLGQTMGQDLGQDKGQLGHGRKKLFWDKIFQFSFVWPIS